MNHPLPDELFEAARTNDRARYAAHLDACADCRAAWGRLRAGSLLLDEAADEAPAVDDFDWSRIDAAVNAEAERVAADIRSGRLRAPRPWKTWVATGVTLAAAASAVAYVKSHSTPPTVDVVAHREGPSQTAPDHGTPSQTAPDSRARFEGAVLLAAGGANVTVNGAATPLAGAAQVTEGARITTGERGRAVLAVQPSVTLDVRPGTEVSLPTMREGGVDVALAQGEVLVDREGDAGAVTLHAGRWNVTAQGDVLARTEAHVVRVVVLAGRASVENGGAAMQYTGPVVIELPDEGAARTVESPATDPLRLDLSLLGATGTRVTLPPLDPSATFSVRDHGALPGALEAMRLASPVRIEARFGGRVMQLDLGNGANPQWRAVTAVASAQPVARRTAAQPAPPAALPTSAIQSPQGRDLTQAEVNAYSRLAAGRFSHCISTCREQNRCAQEITGDLVLEVNALGVPSLASVAHGAEGARTCLEGETSRMRFPATGGDFPFHIRVR